MKRKKDRKERKKERKKRKKERKERKKERKKEARIMERKTPTFCMLTVNDQKGHGHDTKHTVRTSLLIHSLSQI